MNRWTGILPTLPVGARLMITAFVVMIGAGYLIAVANIYQRHGMADGTPGLSAGDIRAVYAGGPRKPGEAMTSHMLTMVTGAMRQYVSSEEDYAMLVAWLKAGGSEAGLDASEHPAAATSKEAGAGDANAGGDGDASADGDSTESRSSRKRRAQRTPRRILIRDCLRCHAQSVGTDIAQIAPFGPDEFEVDYAMMSKFITGDGGAGTGRSPPQYDMARLILHSHQHVLAIPVFTLLIGVLFSLTRMKPTPKSILLPLPMLAALADFASWWLARTNDAWAYGVAGAGAVFGLTLGIQILLILVDVWRPTRADT